MELTYIITNLRPFIAAIFEYWISHAKSMDAIKKTYRREWQEKDSVSSSRAEIYIGRHGSLYEISRVFYRDGHFQRKETWLATYGWHSNGHLIALGRESYLIVDPLSKQLHLEEWTGNQVQLEIYHELNDEI